MTTHGHVLRAYDIKKRYQHGAITTEVLHGVDAHFVQGMSYAITGVSGSGKSTFMHILAGLDTPDAGTIYYDDHNIAEFSPADREYFLGVTLGLSFQSPYLIHELSVIENIMLKGMIIGLEREVCHERAHELLSRVGLEHKAQAHVASLSGGQQQRVSVARALFNRPIFFLADEPTGNLDRDTAQTIISLLIEYQETTSMGLIISTHDPYVADAMSTVLHMRDGRMHTS